MTAGSEGITQLMLAASGGDGGARDRLWAAIYGELRRLAHRQMAREPSGATLQTTVLVHEAYLRLGGDGRVSWENRRHFFGAAGEAMRRICCDEARRRQSLKRGGDHRGLPLDDGPASGDGDPGGLLALDEALRKLEQTAPRQAEVVLLRYFAGLNVDETAQTLGVSARTIDTDWRLARAWLYGELSGADSRLTEGEGG